MINLSKKQLQLNRDIVSPNIPKISVLGSTQSGKTYDICFSLVEYAKNLRLYEEEQRKDPSYIPREYEGIIIGWTTDTVKRNIVDNIEKILKYVYGYKEGVHYTLKYGQQEKYLKIHNMTFNFFGFNTALSFNRILGSPAIFCWVDESARIYSSSQLRLSFDEIIGRQMSYAGHPYYKRIDSYNVEGNSRHPYKTKYIDNWDAKFYTFFPYDNPVLDTEEKIKAVVNGFPPGSLRDQKIFNKWVIAEGKVFQTLNVKQEINYTIREIYIGIDYGSVNPTTFVPIALCYDQVENKWKLVRLECYYHKAEDDNPTTEYYSLQLRMFLIYLKATYPNIPVKNIVIDSEASHFDNRLVVDRIPHELARKGAGSVNEGVEYLQSLFYKGYLEILERPSITNFYQNGQYDESAVDESLIEFESYQYDKIKSENTGINIYKKDMDHSIDATRYCIDLMKDIGVAPIV